MKAINASNVAEACSKHNFTVSAFSLRPVKSILSILAIAIVDTRHATLLFSARCLAPQPKQLFHDLAEFLNRRMMTQNDHLLGNASSFRQCCRRFTVDFCRQILANLR